MFPFKPCPCIKLSLVCTYISINKFDVLFLSETYLDSSISFNDSNLEVPGYNSVFGGNPTINKRGSVCIYYQISVPLKVLDTVFLNECTNFDIGIGGKFCKFPYL